MTVFCVVGGLMGFETFAQLVGIAKNKLLNEKNHNFLLKTFPQRIMNTGTSSCPSPAGYA
jgi:hypothetical protein